MLQRLAEGETDPAVQAGEARGGLRKKEAQLREALAVQLDPLYRFLLRQHLEHVELLRRQLDEIKQALATAMKEHTATLARLIRIPGVRVCPGSQESAGVCHNHRSAKGNRYLRRLLNQIAWAAIHTKNTFFAGLFAHLLPRIEKKGTAWAVAHRIARVVWLLLHEGVEYQEKGARPAQPRTLLRKFRGLLTEFARAGLDAKQLLDQPASVTA